MTTNRDTALNTVYQSKHLAHQVEDSLYDADEITSNEWLYSDLTPVQGGWMIHLGHIGLSRDTTEESSL
jgi:hypothetical protein